MQICSINKAIIMGFADEPVISSFDGKRLAHLNVTTYESWKSRIGTQYDRTDTHRVVVLEPIVDYVEGHISKGALVYVEGRLQVRKFVNKSGDGVSVEIVVSVHGAIKLVAPPAVGAAA